MHIAIDAMGGDYGPRVIVEGCIEALKRAPFLKVTLFGQQSILESSLRALPQGSSPFLDRMSLSFVDSVLPVTSAPSDALRTSFFSPSGMTSLHAALMALKRGEVDGCVSGGDTGALMAVSRHLLGMIPGIDRPAISSAIPTLAQHPCYMLDLGANVDCQPRHLVQFAIMGAEMVRVVHDVGRPRVALLNIGSETRKGSRLVRETDAILRAMEKTSFDYVGYIEGDGIYSGVIDLVVCDGFVGNVALKTSEGLARMLGRKLQSTFNENWRTRLVSVLARPALSRFREDIDPVRYNGASLLGLSATVVKSHGSADARGFSYAVARAVSELKGQLPQRLSQGLAGQGTHRSI